MTASGPSLLRRNLRRLQRVLPTSRRGFLILAYHLVGAGTDSPVDVPEGTFRHHMEELRDAATVSTLDDALRDSNDPRPAQAPRVVVTFDDAYENFHRVAWPVLRALSIPALLYVPVGFVSGEADAPIRGTGHLPPCTWDELRQVRDEGTVELGSHGVLHRDLRRLAADEVRWELEESRRRLEDRLQVDVEHFCYPEGFTSPTARREAARWYRTAVVGEGRRAHPRRGSRFALPRVPMRRDLPSLQPLLTCRVWLEEWLGARLRAVRRRRTPRRPS